MNFRAEYGDNEMEVFTAESNEEAIEEAMRMETEHGTLFNVTRMDDDYNELETIF